MKLPNKRSYGTKEDKLAKEATNKRRQVQREATEPKEDKLAKEATNKRRQVQREATEPKEDKLAKEKQKKTSSAEIHLRRHTG